jgi:Fe-S-cluster containining protein
VSLDTIYAAVPALECKGLCQSACGPIGCSGAEAQRLQDLGITLPTTVTHPIHGPLTCSHLSDEGRCKIYEHRPLICRLFGAAEGLQCPHGCKPKKYMKHVDAHKLFDLADLLSDEPPYHPTLPDAV